MTVIGSFAIRNNISDIGIMIVLGVIGWIASKRGFSVSPIVLGLILGRIAEQGFVQSWTIGDAMDDLWGQFFGRPLSLAIIAMTLVSFIYPFAPQIRHFFRSASAEPAPTPARASPQKFWADLVTFAVFGAIGLVVLIQAAGLNPEAAVFPRTIAMGMLVIVAIAVARLFLICQVTDEPITGSSIRRVSVPAIMLLAVLAMSTVGFALAGLIMALALIIPAQHGRLSGSVAATLTLGVAGIILIFTFGFSEILSVPLPPGQLF
jgi:putative tricarboxylic transport membrane protein